MFKCPECGSETEFYLWERVWQKTRVTWEGDEMTYHDVVESDPENEWDTVTCTTCGHEAKYEIFTQAYAETHYKEE